MTPRQRSALFQRLQKANPLPTTELVFRTPFELLISVILSAQATDVSVNRATAGLFKVANTPAAILALGEQGLKQHIRTIGLFNTKAGNILRTCRALLDQHGGEVPRDRAALEALPGVGRKTANVVLNTAFGEPTIAVDTHIFRVANRTGLAPGKTPRAVEDGLLATTPTRFRRHAHHWLLLHGRYICKARQPDCPHCPIAKQCEYQQKATRQERRQPRPLTTMHNLYLALDQGGHASRALLFSGSGDIVAQSAVPIATLRSGEGHIEHDPAELVASLRQAMTNVCTGLPGGTRLAAAGLATQRSSMACWNRHTGAALSPVISWQDRRNATWLQRMAPQADEIRARTGLVLTPHYGASKMRWCLDHLPAVERARAGGELVMGPLASFLVCNLVAGRPLLADPANASRTQLWELATRDWSPELLALFGIDAAVLPRAVTSRYTYGDLVTPAGPVPLTVVTGDQSAVPFAFGPLDPATAYVNLGTGAFAQRPVSGQLPDAPRLLVSVVWSTTEHVDYLLEGTVNGAGSALDWLAERESIPLPQLLSAADAALAARETPPLFINGVSGLGAPFWVSNLESRFIGAGSLGARVLGVLESIAFLLQANLEEMQPHGPALTGLLVTGGLSANDYLCGCLGSLSGLPVRRTEDPEATARGLARLVAGGAAAAWSVARGTSQAPVLNGELEQRYRQWRQELAQSMGRALRP